MAEVAPDKGMLDGLTTDEWATAWNCTSPLARKVITTALKGGKMETGHVMRPCLLRPGWRTKHTVHRIKG